MEYFIIDENNQQAGPFSLEQLAEKLITPETLVWSQGMKDWTPAWKVAELRTTLEAAEAIRANAATSQANNSNGTQPNSGSAVPPNYQQEQSFQQAYQQGFQQGAAISQGNHNRPEESRKKSTKKLWKIILGLIAFILLVFAFTNPSSESHKEKVRTEMTKVVDKATATSDNNFFTQGIRSVAKMLAGTAIDGAMDQLFEYHNYIFFSKGSVNFDNKEHTISFGILGKVYTMNANDMVKALEDADNLSLPSSDDNSLDEDSNDDTNADATDGLGTNVQKRLEDKANQALDKAADKVSKKVEEQINKKLNEAADSSKIEKVIDKLLELI